MPYNVMRVGMLGSEIIQGVLLDETLLYIEICLGFILPKNGVYGKPDV